MSVEEFARKLRQLKALTCPSMENGERPDAEAVLRLIAEMRGLLPDDVGSPRQSEDARTRSTDGMPVETEEDFEWAAVIDGMSSLFSDLENFVEQKRAAQMDTLLRIYHAVEEASRDPANAHLIEDVERMRAAYEEGYGRPIPPKDGSSEDGV
jgi:hypothetical protein